MSQTLASTAPPSPPPAEGDARLTQTIRKLQQQNEILLAWVQTGVIAFLGSLYLLAPKGFDGQTTFQPVRVILELYMPIVVLRLVLSYRTLPRRSWLIAFVVIDMLMLTGLMASYHVQYRQPPVFSLKSTTFIYYFLFLALNALRYETIYLVTAGASAMLGWIAIVIYSIRSGDPITRSYTEYILGNRVLVGAEVDKLITLALVTFVLIVGVRRSRRVLFKSVADAQRAAVLSRFFSPDVVSRIVDSDVESLAPGRGELRSAVILSIDIRGFSTLSAELSPAHTMELLTEYHRRMVGPIFESGGSIDKYLGDGILAHFGISGSTETPCAAAMRCVETLIRAGQDWNREREAAGAPPLDIGFSCALGNAVFGAVGDKSKLELTVIGDVVNLAAKLEKHNKRLSAMALTTRRTYETACAQGYVPTVSPRFLEKEEIDGLPYKVDLVVLASRRAETLAA